MEDILKLINYSEHKWNVCGDLKVKVYFLPLHIKFGLIKNFVVAMDRDVLPSTQPNIFFFRNLAFLDMSYSSMTAPRMLFDLVTKSLSITFPACTTQMFFFFFSAASELYLLSAMSYDHYVAICHPLHYQPIMSWKVCPHLAFVIWVFGLFYSLTYSSYSCSGCPSVVVLLWFQFFFPYVCIFCTILRIPSNCGKLKAFSFCTSHLTVVFIFYIIFIIWFPPLAICLV
uniref:G-protein coupled receptors family 1 profile domain-containing protein n=1 Tax=Pyxicephalus adspersus TaxID=30357 RepID=A0AAV2ZUY0_PYXAD|nr:TPA: hypothetical protein GDO54_016682 [Pyxicephalus adspersus]